MTVFDKTTDLPATVNTVEKLAFWTMALLYDLYKGRGYKEAEGSAIDSGLAPLVDFSIVSTADGNQRAIVRLSLELDPAYLTDGDSKLWTFSQPFGDIAIPAGFKS